MAVDSALKSQLLALSSCFPFIFQNPDIIFSDLHLSPNICRRNENFSSSLALHSCLHCDQQLDAYTHKWCTVCRYTEVDRPGQQEWPLLGLSDSKPFRIGTSSSVSKLQFNKLDHRCFWKEISVWNHC
ncbi:hypothetical protein ACLB2K_017783 [Fragaria x ananassa]